jgi:hypothetical protein
MEEDEYTIEYHHKTVLYHLPLTPSSSSSILRSFELLAYFSEDILNFVSKFSDSTADILDFPSHVLPTLESLLLQKKSLYLRLPHGSDEINTSPLTLHQHLSQNRRISEKLLHRWTIQILRTLTAAHQMFLYFPEFDSTNILLLSDEIILSAYRLQKESKKKRTRAQDEMKALRRAQSTERVLGGSTSFSSSDKRKFPEIGSNKSQFNSLLSQKSQETHTPSSNPLPSSNSSLSSQSQSTTRTLTDPSLAVKFAPRKDAWLFLPFAGISQSPMPIIGEETLPAIPTRTEIKSRQTRREATPPSDTALDLEQSTITQWLTKYKINRREKIIKEQTMHELVSIVIRSGLLSALDLTVSLSLPLSLCVCVSLSLSLSLSLAWPLQISFFFSVRVHLLR